MHDSIWFEIHQVPALSIASSEFQEAAETQARALGLAEARCLFVQHPIQDATDEEMRTKADELLERVAALVQGQIQSFHGSR